MELCRLPERFDTLPLEDQARLILECRIKDAAVYRDCAARQAELADWIRRGEKEGAAEAAPSPDRR